MAQKRMFDNLIIDTDQFMDMSHTAKLLYFLLGMKADDEGFVSPRMVMKVHSINDDDLRVLIAKGYLIVFESGVVVITDWNQNNWLDKRRLQKTKYQKEVNQLSIINGKYIKKDMMLSDGLAVAKQMLGENRIEENRIEENRIEENRIEERIVKNKKNKINEKTIEIANALNTKFNDIMGTRGKSIKGFVTNIDYWLEDYSVEDIEQAIENIPKHHFWKDRMTLEILFRKKRPNGEKASWIKDLLNTRSPTQTVGKGEVYQESGYEKKLKNVKIHNIDDFK